MFTPIAAATIAAYLLLAFLCFRDMLKNPESARVVRLHKLVGIAGMICGGLFSLGVTALVWAGGNRETGFLFCGFTGLCDVLMIAFLNIKIEYDDDGFTARAWTGKARRFSYADITGIRRGRDTKLFFGRKRVSVDELSVGGDEFLRFLAVRYERTHGAKPIPQARYRAFDLFRGNVRNPGEFLFVYILITAVCLSPIAMVLYTSRALGPQDMRALSVRFQRHETADGDLILRSDEYAEAFEIRYAKRYGDALRTLEEALNRNAHMRVHAKRYAPNAKEAYYVIYNLTDDNGREYVAFDDANAYARAEAVKSIPYFLIFTFVWLLYVIFSVRVGRNPQKYSRRVKRLFFQDGYIKKRPAK